MGGGGGGGELFLLAPPFTQEDGHDRLRLPIWILAFSFQKDTGTWVSAIAFTSRAALQEVPGRSHRQRVTGVTGVA